MEASREMTLAEIAALVEGRLTGDASTVVRGIAGLFEAGPEEMALLAAGKYADRARESRAGSFLVADAFVDACGDVPSVRVPDAHKALRRVLEALYPPQEAQPTIHATAVLGRGVRLGKAVTIGPYAVIGDGTELGDGVRIGAHVCVGEGCQVGPRTRIHPQVVLYDGTRVGADVVLHAGVRLGVDGFGYVLEEGEHRRLPHVGGCVVEDGVEIGANTCVDRGSIGLTRIGAGTKIDNQVHLAHNVQIGERSLIVAQVGIAGSTRVGKGVVMGGQAGLSNHLDIGDGAQIAAQAGVIGDVAAGEVVMGFPARPRREFLRGQASLTRLPETLRRLRAEDRASDS